MQLHRSMACGRLHSALQCSARFVATMPTTKRSHVSAPVDAPCWPAQAVCWGCVTADRRCPPLDPRVSLKVRRSARASALSCSKRRSKCRQRFKWLSSSARQHTTHASFTTCTVWGSRSSSGERRCPRRCQTYGVGRRTKTAYYERDSAVVEIQTSRRTG